MTRRGRKLAALATATLAMAWGGSIKASSDFSCTAIWLVTTFAPDCANRAFLDPGNETRVNLLLLTAPPPPMSEPGPSTQWDQRRYGNTFFSWEHVMAVYGRLPASERLAYADAGSRCDSLSAGHDAFIAAIKASKLLRVQERDTLAAARMALVADCTGVSHPIADRFAAGVTSRTGKAYLAYLAAADAFYAGDWDKAARQFALLSHARDPWLAETAHYMAIRVALNAAQRDSFNDYGDFSGIEHVDQAAAQRGKAAIEAYLERYPDGLYTDSARGLLRRALWLTGDTVAIAGEYERVLAHTPPGGQEALLLIQEIDRKLFQAPGAAKAIRTPLLLAAFDLMRMRYSRKAAAVSLMIGPAMTGKYDPSEADREELKLTGDMLEAQQPIFAGHPDLFRYLLAVHAYYVMEASSWLAMPGEGASFHVREPLTPLAFSTLVLRGLAMSSNRDPGEQAYLRQLIGLAHAPFQRPLAELMLALAKERSGHAEEVFAPGSLITDPVIREILLASVMGPGTLRQVAQDLSRDAHEREVALYTLLRRELDHGQFGEFLSDYRLLPADPKAGGTFWDVPFDDTVPLGLYVAGTWSDGFECPQLVVTVRHLASRPGDPAARLCLGDFWRLNGFDRLAEPSQDPETSLDALGSSASHYPGKSMSRASLYDGIMVDRRVPSPLRAYALFRAIHCYAPNGRSDCGGPPVSLAQRRIWFVTLKQTYRDTVWAQRARYYW